MEERRQEYENQRRRLNARLGLVDLALLPLPSVLIAVGREHWDSLSDVVEGELQSCPRFCRRDACSTDRLRLPLKWTFLWPSRGCCPDRWRAGPSERHPS